MTSLSEYMEDPNDKVIFNQKDIDKVIGSIVIVNDIRDAVEHVRKELSNRSEILENLTYVNNQKHATMRTKGGLYYILYKRDFFHSFGKIFGNVGGVGESINESCLKRAIMGNVKTILVVYSDGKIYAITPVKWRDYAQKYRTIRTTTEKDMGYGNERTFSVSIKELERWNV